jgi:sialate O-acetylesterase
MHTYAVRRLSRAVASIAASLLCVAGAARANVRLPALFSDHAILQRDVPLPVWGWAAPGETVTVSLGESKATTKSGASGKWSVRLAPQPATGRPVTLTVAGKNTITVQDIMMGDVWLCGGQSNMEFSLGAADAPDDIRSADLPLVRHFGVEYNFANTPQSDVKGRWQVCTPETAPGFTAVGFYFGRKVHAETGVPIGLLRSCVGGTNIELWMSQDTLMNTPALSGYAAVMRASLDRYQRELAEALPRLERWTQSARSAQKAKKSLPMPPDWPVFPFSEQAQRPRSVTLHNGMIAPLVPFAMKGAIWYQGESNAGSAADGEQYIEKNRAMLADWRSWFGNANLPFYFVQLASWLQPTDDPAGGDGWAYMREAQRHALAIPHTGMALALDIGDAGDIHPKNKMDVGERLALWALANEYGKKIEVSGPLMREARVEVNRIRISFDHVGAGLMVGRKSGRTPAVEDTAGTLRRFGVAGADRVWHWADARIDGDTVVVSSPQVPSPVAVRYAFSMNPAGANLYNRDGLPASPFRTDDW